MANRLITNTQVITTSIFHHLFLKAACEKTVSLMHHVIKRTITYANGNVCLFCARTRSWKTVILP